MVSGDQVVLIDSTFVESPWVYGGHANKKRGLHSLNQFYGNVPGCDYEDEWGITLRTLEHEKAMLEQMGTARWMDTTCLSDRT